MLWRRVLAILYSGNVSLQSRKWRVVALLKVLYETRRAPLRDIEDVVQDQDLAVDMRPGTDSDNGNIEFCRRSLANFVLQTPGRVNHLASLVGIPALYLETADFVH